MLQMEIPGYTPEALTLEHLMLDFNGTLAIDGALIVGVRESLNQISKFLEIHVVTGNSFGTAPKELEGIPCHLTLLEKHNQRNAKLDYVQKLGKDRVISIGNGNNDVAMLENSVIGVVLIQKEGGATAAIRVADLCCTDILDALDLLLHPIRLTASLRR